MWHTLSDWSVSLGLEVALAALAAGLIGVRSYRGRSRSVNDQIDALASRKRARR